MKTVIRAKDLTRRFGSFVAVDHLNFEINEGQVVGYLGPNGSGKTTTMRMLLGILHPSEGEAQVLGYDVARQSEEIRSRSGYMSQKFALYQELTAVENLAFYAGVYGVKEPARVKEVISSLGLDQVADQPVHSLSSGWKQRLALAAAIVHRPRLLFLDEPTSGVDPVARRAFWDLIYTLVEGGITALVSTHYMDEAEYCQQVGIMRAGKLLALDTPSRLKAALPGHAWDVYAEPLLPAIKLLEALRTPSSPTFSSIKMGGQAGMGVVRASLASDHLRVITQNGLEKQNLAEALSQAGIQVISIEPAATSMEDVFLTLSQS
jgi:ABC-2 type transport system ATP-binding protein